MKALFHIPGISTHYELNYNYIKLMKEHPEYFRDDVAVDSVYGTFPPALWNGGRSIQGNVPLEAVKKIVSDYNSLGVRVRLTFTNTMLRPEHLDDEYCNELCRIAENDINEIIIYSPMLEEYIRKKYPKFTYTSSTCKQIEDPDELKKELEKDYRLVVLDYNWNNNFEFLETLPHKEKCEFLLDAICISHCPNRKYHYQYLGQQQIITNEVLPFVESFGGGTTTVTPEGMKPFQCPYNTSIETGMNQTTYISPDAVYEKYLPMGFSNFKIEGRTYKRDTVMNEYVKYMVKPEYEYDVRGAMEPYIWNFRSPEPAPDGKK